MKRKEYKYPIYKKSKINRCVVKFTGLQKGVVIKDFPNSCYSVGYKSFVWVEHTNSMVWEDYNYNYKKEI